MPRRYSKNKSITQFGRGVVHFAHLILKRLKEQHVGSTVIVDNNATCSKTST